MSVTIINGCVLLPFRCAGSAKLTRRWSTAIAPGAAKGEERWSMMATPFRGISFTSTVWSAPERYSLEASLNQALATGKAAVPTWGRGLALQAMASVGTNSLSLFSVKAVTNGEWFFLMVENGATHLFQAVQVSSVVSYVSGVYTVALVQTLNFDNPAGSFARPLLFGTPTVSNYRPFHLSSGALQINVDEPLGAGAVSDSSACPAVSETDLDVDVSICGGNDAVPVLSVGPAANCVPSKILTWTSCLGATEYHLKHATAPGGPYALLATIIAPTTNYTVAIPMITPTDYYVVSSVVGGIESANSNEVIVFPITIEREMRALQERYHVSSGLWLNFPDRLSDSTNPGHYPADGFYAVDLAGGGAARAATLVQFLFNSLANAWLNNYATTKEWEGLGTIPVYDLTLLPILTVNSGNYQSCLASMFHYCCVLDCLVIQATAVNSAQRTGEHYGSGNCNAAKVAATADWGSNVWFGTGPTWPEVYSFTEYDPTYPYTTLYHAAFNTYRANLRADITGTGPSAPKMFVRLRKGGTVKEPGDSGYDALASVPVSDLMTTCPLTDTSLLDFTFHQSDVLAPDVVYVSPLYGSEPGVQWFNGCPVSATGVTLYYGWAVKTAKAQVYKSSNPALAHWTYYP